MPQFQKLVEIKQAYVHTNVNIELLAGDFIGVLKFNH